MSSEAPMTAAVFEWHARALQPLDSRDLDETTLTAADSWLVRDGRVLAIDLHRSRFLRAVRDADTEGFWDAAMSAIPREGDWFPRIEKHTDGRMLFRLRSAPSRSRSVSVITAPGPDLRTTPTTKGPDLRAMRGLRASAEDAGAGEAIILSGDGCIVEGSYSALVWWRGAILCSPPADAGRVESVTATSLIGLATALGVETHTEAVTPAEVDGTEVWALNALHGARIVTRWIEGPQTAELPGRLAQWRSRLDALTHPLPEAAR